MLFNLIDRNLARVMLLLAISSGSKYSRDDLKKKTGMNNIPLDFALNKLMFFKFIKKENKLYYFNLEDPFVKSFISESKTLLNLPLKIQFILYDAIDILSRFKGIRKIILFGSYSKLIFHENSDIDLAVIIDDKIDDAMKIEHAIFPFFNKLSKKYKKEIEAHYFNESDLKHKEDPLIKDIVRNGRVLI